MSSNLARDIVYQVWSELLMQRLLQALVETLVFEQNFFASRGAVTQFHSLPDGEAIARNIRMRDACGDASVTVACVLKATWPGQCALWLEVRRDSFTLDEPAHKAELLVLRELATTPASGANSPEQAQEQLTNLGVFSEDLAAWAGCLALGEELAGVLAP